MLLQKTKWGDSILLQKTEWRFFVAKNRLGGLDFAPENQWGVSILLQRLDCRKSTGEIPFYRKKSNRGIRSCCKNRMEGSNLDAKIELGIGFFSEYRLRGWDPAAGNRLWGIDPAAENRMGTCDFAANNRVVEVDFAAKNPMGIGFC